jgi:hypothetical protein
MTDRREKLTDRRRGVRRPRPRRVEDSADKARWNKAYKFNLLGITEDQFNGLLERQDYSCAICREPFGDRRICVDHDHNCCKPEPDRKLRTCGKCIRGLLCVPCNTGLGFIERMYDLASAYLANRVDYRGLT